MTTEQTPDKGCVMWLKASTSKWTFSSKSIVDQISSHYVNCFDIWMSSTPAIACFLLDSNILAVKVLCRCCVLQTKYYKHDQDVSKLL